jgi:hypothetical protein
VDEIGQAADRLSTKSQLRVMDWVVAYQGTLRGLGVQEVRFAVWVCSVRVFACRGGGGFHGSLVALSFRSFVQKKFEAGRLCQKP